MLLILLYSSILSWHVSEGLYTERGASQVALEVKNLPTNTGEIRDTGSIPGRGRSLEEGTATHQYSCLEKPMDRGAW